MRRGLFGGTFDPPHVAHIMMAEIAREQLMLDVVEFIPAARPPHKTDKFVTPVDERLALVTAAIRDYPAFVTSDVETRREGPSFTVDTVISYRHENPDDWLCLIVGADMLIDFVRWKDATQIAKHVELVVAPRPGIDVGAATKALREGVPEARVTALQMPALDVSSTWLRERIRDTLLVAPLLPAGVVEQIAKRGLYRDG